MLLCVQHGCMGREGKSCLIQSDNDDVCGEVNTEGSTFVAARAALQLFGICQILKSGFSICLVSDVLCEEEGVPFK